MTSAKDQKKEEIHNVLMAILKRDGEIKPDRVIEEARNPKSPLHSEFEWDVEKAAMETWRNQARHLISGFTVLRVVNRTEYLVSEFVENPIKAERHFQGYVSFEAIAADPEMSQRFLDRELGIADTYVQKSANYAAALGLTKKVEGLSRRIKAIRDMAKPAGAQAGAPSKQKAPAVATSN